MPETTGISWTDSTWNPWMGCDKVSPGCAHCYMFRDQRKYGNNPEIIRRSKTKFRDPLKWKDGRLVFTCSWSDWFHEAADPWRDEAWDVVRACPQHTFQILTKRPDLIADRLPADWGEGWPNVWLGVSIENSRYTWRAEILRMIPASLRFISAEPLLGSLFKGPTSGESPDRADTRGQRDAGSIPAGSTSEPRPLGDPRPAGKPDADDVSEGGAPTRERAPLDLSGIGWVIVGGESGYRKDARPVHPHWVREIRDTTLYGAPGARPPYYGAGLMDEVAVERWYAGRPKFHFKQWGSWAPVRRSDPKHGDLWLLPDGSTETYQGEPGERDSIGSWLVRYDGSDAVLVRFAGDSPHSGGKILDTVDWCEIPDRPVPVTPA